MRECSHNLIEIEKQIIDYLNQIKHQGEFLEKLRKLKYLKDHFTIEAETDIKQLLARRNQVLFEKRISEPLNLSLEFIRNDEKAFESIKKIAKKHKDRKLFKPEMGDRISDEILENKTEEEIIINLGEVCNQFIATSDHLFNFVMNYDFLKELSFSERVTIFCQISSQYEKDLKIEKHFQTSNGIEYALVYPK